MTSDRQATSPASRRRGAWLCFAALAGVAPLTAQSSEIVEGRLAPRAAQVVRHGLGCAGSAGVPRLLPAGGSLPRLGSAFQQILTGVSEPGHVTLILGTSITTWRGHDLPMQLDSIGMRGCELLVRPDILLAMPVSRRGIGHLALSIPDDPALVGIQLATQAMLIDIDANAAAVAFSNALVFYLGR